MKTTLHIAAIEVPNLGSRILSGLSLENLDLLATSIILYDKYLCHLLGAHMEKVPQNEGFGHMVTEEVRAILRWITGFIDAIRRSVATVSFADELMPERSEGLGIRADTMVIVSSFDDQAMSPKLWTIKLVNVLLTEALDICMLNYVV